MSLVHIDPNPSRNQLAVFGVVWLAFFGVFGGMVLRHGGPQGLAAAAWLAAVVVPGIGWFSPGFLRLVYLGMAILTFPIGFVVSFLVLAAVFYLVFAPIGLLMRLFMRDPMTRRFDPAAQSYWTPRHTCAETRRYFRQF